MGFGKAEPFVCRIDEVAGAPVRETVAPALCPQLFPRLFPRLFVKVSLTIMLYDLQNSDVGKVAA